MKNEMLNNPTTEETAGKTRWSKLENKGNNRRKRGNNKLNKEKQGKEGRKFRLEFGVF